MYICGLDKLKMRFEIFTFISYNILASSSLVPCKLHDPDNGECMKTLWQNILISGINGKLI